MLGFLKKENSSNGAKLTRKEQKARERIKEYKVFKITKKNAKIRARKHSERLKQLNKSTEQQNAELKSS